MKFGFARWYSSVMLPEKVSVSERQETGSTALIMASFLRSLFTISCDFCC